MILLADTNGLPVDWSNLSALGTLIALVLWFATKGLPNIMQRHSDAEAAARRDFQNVTASIVAECRQQRQDFREEAESQRQSFEEMLRHQREQSASLAISGHEAVNGLSAELRDLKVELKSR